MGTGGEAGVAKAFDILTKEMAPPWIARRQRDC